jgi:ornithine cyclodeaminase/alanine dehydrogenase-like protein (mu-crystallin family)
LDKKVSVVGDYANFEEAVRGSGVVALTTHAATGVIDAAWVDAGCHVSSVGSSAELPGELVGIGPLIVDHRGAVTTAPPAGAEEIQHVDPDSVIEIGELLARTRTGRTSPEEITVYKSTGHAVQDLAAAQLVYQAALLANVGSTVAL